MTQDAYNKERVTKAASKEVQYQTLLEKEFRIAYPLSHPNIVRTLGIEDVPELGTCIIQKYIFVLLIWKRFYHQAVIFMSIL